MKLAGERVAAAIHAQRAPSPPSDSRLDQIRTGVARRRRARRTKLALAGGAIVALTVAGSFGLRTTLDPELSFRVDGAEGEVGRFVAASSEEVELAFDDGSSLRLSRDGRARVLGLSEHGAHVVIEDGAMHVDVVHRAETAWTITAGPFDVHVIGTSFVASWSPAEEALTVSMREGVVNVTGACLADATRMESRETLRFSCRDVVREMAPVSTAVPATASGPQPSASAVISSSARGSAAPDAVSWRQLSKKGEFKRAFEALESSGALRELEGMDPTALLEVADVARLAGRPDVARAAFVVARTHPTSDASATAAFHLGRASAGDEAARWFRTYLSERPNGPFAREAMGRLLELERGQPGGRDLARRYLERFPDGAHAPLARAILE